MKRTLSFLFAIAVATSLIAETAILQDIKGKVEVKALGGSWLKAANGMKIDILSTISTGFDSTAVLAIADNRVAVAPLTRLTVDKIVAQAGTLKTSLNLRVGSLSAQVKSSAGVAQEFKVTSPYSTASVRGTQFTYDGLALSVHEGRVAFIPGRPVRDIVLPVFRSSGGSQEGASSTSETPGQTSGPGTPAAGQGTQSPSGSPNSVGQPPTDTGTGGQMGAAAFMAALQTEFQGDSFSFSNAAGQNVPPPTFTAPPSGGQGGGLLPASPPAGAGAPPPPGAGAPPPPPPIFISAGYVIFVAVNYSAPTGTPQNRPSAVVSGAMTSPPPGTGGGASGQFMPGGGVLAPPVIRPQAGAATGSISVHWN